MKPKTKKIKIVIVAEVASNFTNVQIDANDENTVEELCHVLYATRALLGREVDNAMEAKLIDVESNDGSDFRKNFKFGQINGCRIK